MNGIHLFHYKPYMVKMWYISTQTTGIYVLLKCKVQIFFYEFDVLLFYRNH